MIIKVQFYINYVKLNLLILGLSTSLCNLGSIYYEQQKLNEAENAFLRAKAIDIKTYGENYNSYYLTKKFLIIN